MMRITFIQYELAYCKKSGASGHIEYFTYFWFHRLQDKLTSMLHDTLLQCNQASQTGTANV